MKTIILSGGFGTRILELTASIPKPMIEIGGKPMLWHIMSHYSVFGFSEFVIALGYKAEVVKKYFLDFYDTSSDMTLKISAGKKEILRAMHPEWTVHLVDTGSSTQTGGRLKRLKNWIGNETFMMTYGDGLSNVNINELIAFHRKHGRLATVTAVKPFARFGNLSVNGNEVVAFSEKNQPQEGWINGGFFVLEPEVFDLIDSDETVWEKDPLERLSSSGELMAFFHEGFWHPMDTLKEQRYLDSLWANGSAPWKFQETQ